MSLPEWRSGWPFGRVCCSLAVCFQAPARVSDTPRASKQTAARVAQPKAFTPVSAPLPTVTYSCIAPKARKSSSLRSEHQYVRLCRTQSHPKNPVLSPKTTLYAGIQPFLELPAACTSPHRPIQARRPGPCSRQHSEGLHALHPRRSQTREGPRPGPETAPAPRHWCHSSPTHYSQAAWPGQRLAGDVLPA